MQKQSMPDLTKQFVPCAQSSQGIFAEQRKVYQSKQRKSEEDDAQLSTKATVLIKSQRAKQRREGTLEKLAFRETAELLAMVSVTQKLTKKHYP